MTYIGDVIGSITGGINRGAIYEGRFDPAVDADFDKLIGWTGTKFHANIYQIHGRGLTRNYIGNLATISEIEALPDTRLYEAYFEQSWGDKLSLRVGQQAADTEFFRYRDRRPFHNKHYRLTSDQGDELAQPAVRHRRLRQWVRGSRPKSASRSRPLPRSSTATRQGLARATRNCATIMVWHSGSGTTRG